MNSPQRSRSDEQLASVEGATERKKMLGRAGVVASGTLISRLLGLVRDQTMAALFSRSQTDAFWLAFTIPNALRQLLGEGAASSAVVPVLAKVREEEGERQAREFFRVVRGTSLLALVSVSILGILFARPIVELFGGGLHARGDAAFDRAVILTQWLFPYIFFMGSAALGMAALNTYGRFASAALAPALLNVAFIACAFGLRSAFEQRGLDPVLVLAVGALLGGGLQVMAQWPDLRRLGFLGSPLLRLSDPRSREVFRRMGPMLLGIGIYSIDLVFSRRFLSELPEGSQSYFSWAMRLCDFPQGIFVLALQSATLPSLARLSARGAFDEVGRTYAYGMRLCMFVALPASVLLVGLAHPLVVCLFQRGAFDELSASETARSLMVQGCGIWTVAAVRQLVSAFYALGDTRTPVLVSALDLVVFLVGAIALKGHFGHVGVAGAVTASSLVQMGLLWGMLGRRLPSLHLREIGLSMIRTVVASFVALGAGWPVAHCIAGLSLSLALHRLLPGALSGVAFVLVYLVAAMVLRSPEMAPLVRRMTRSKFK